MTNQEIIAVVQAAERGEAIEFRLKGADRWCAAERPFWDFANYDYRVKPEPLTIWCNVYGGGDDGRYQMFGFTTQEDAQRYAANSKALRVAVRMVEAPE